MSARRRPGRRWVFVLRDQLCLLLRQPAPRDGDHPQPLGRQLTHGVVDVRPDVVARGQNHFGCALDGQLVAEHRRRERPARPER